MRHLDQASFWNDVAGPRWVQAQARLDLLLAPITERLLRTAAATEGERVIDIGCGYGTTTLALAEQVGATGAVLGVDISATMLKRAKALTQAEHVQFACADAATYDFDTADADLVVSRLGVMFFSDSTAAFAHIRTAMKEGGRCVFACWQSLASNPWLSFPLQAAADVLPPMPPPRDGPGPFRFADRDRTTDMLRDAGFDSVAIEPLETEASISGSVEEIVTFFQMFGPASRMLPGLDQAVRAAALERIHAALTQLHDGERVTWSASSFIVRASTGAEAAVSLPRVDDVDR